MRNQRAILFLILSAVCGLITAYGVNLWVKSAERARAASPIATAPVVIAARDLAAGAAIESRLVDVSEWPVDYLPRGVFAEAESVANRVPHHRIAAGEPIFENLRRAGVRAAAYSFTQKSKAALINRYFASES